MHKFRPIIASAIVTVIIVFALDSNKAAAVTYQDAEERQTNEEADEDLGEEPDETVEEADSISPYWSPLIQQWSDLIIQESKANGIDPDLVSAVIEAESNGDQLVVSRVGAVGLMGIMPTGPGLEWRPEEDKLFDPE
ncbi:MAG: transglycosylase SLT domain-containing protein, partial [Candidatus Promineifilaceae bacterium]